MAASASSVVNSALATNIFDVPFVKRTFSRVCFVAGPPLGYYGSWALFSLSHHFIVWLSAEKVDPGHVFRDYAVLGDDYIIADKLVAPVYAEYVERLGVDVSYAKSIISVDRVCRETSSGWTGERPKSYLSPLTYSLLSSVRTICYY